MIKLFVIILALYGSIISCASPPKYKTHCGPKGIYFYRLPINIDMKALYDFHKEETLKAIANWNKTSGRTLFINNNQLPSQVLIVYGTSFTGTVQANTVTFEMGPVIRNATIFVNRVSLDEGVDTQSLMEHELGHTLGIQHVDNTIMNPTLRVHEIRLDISDEIINIMNCLYN